jgi:hypothetical protein
MAPSPLGPIGGVTFDHFRQDFHQPLHFDRNLAGLDEHDAHFISLALFLVNHLAWYLLIGHRNHAMTFAKVFIEVRYHGSCFPWLIVAFLAF